MANVQNMSDAREWVMNQTKTDLCTLALYMGYGWTAGTNGKFPGQNMLMDGNKWVPDMTGPKDGYKADQRLVVEYGDWTLKIKDIQFQKAVVENMTPISVKSATIVNNEPHPVTEKFTKKAEVIRQVIHSTESNFSAAASVGASITYKPEVGFGGGASFKLGIEESTVNETSTGDKDIAVFTEADKKTLRPHSAARWDMMVSRMKATTRYRAKVAIGCSVKFDGFLRWGGADGSKTNFHRDHKGSEGRPTVPFKFGNASKSFAKDLKEHNDQGKIPWLWSEMKQRYSNAQPVIDKLTNEANYEFEIAGKIEDIKGRTSYMVWKDLEILGADE